MAWSFSTDPDFVERLDWARTFMKERVYPLETLHLDEAAFRRLAEPLKQEVKEPASSPPTYPRSWVATATVRSTWPNCTRSSAGPPPWGRSSSATNPPTVGTPS